MASSKRASCTQGKSAQRPSFFFVHRSQIDAVLEKLKARLSRLTIGSPLDEHTTSAR